MAGSINRTSSISFSCLFRILKDLYGKFRRSCKLPHPVAFGLILGRIQFSLDREPTFFPLCHGFRHLQAKLLKVSDAMLPHPVDAFRRLVA